MTLPSVDRDRLIFFASVNRSPVDSVCDCRSLHQRILILKLIVATFFSNVSHLVYSVSSTSAVNLDASVFQAAGQLSHAGWFLSRHVIYR